MSFLSNEILDNWPTWEFGLGSRGQYQLVEEEDSSILYVSAPGYKSQDITVEMHEGRLTITGSPSVDHRTVLVSNKINIRFTVNPSVLVESAEFQDGLLAVRLNRPKNKVDPMKIPIKSL